MVDAFSAVRVGGVRLANRIAMAPMTRNRAGDGETATPLMAEYYRQRASAGLIVTEAVQPSLRGQSYVHTPGLFTEEQTRSWRQVTEAVHEAGGRIFAQLLHGGREGHPDVRQGLLPEAPSAVAAPGLTHTPSGMKDNVVPIAMTEADIERALADFAGAARNAVAAGFDGVQLHGANGYLIHQFLCSDANVRTDRWGVTPEGRTRFAVAAVEAVADVVGAERTSLRVSPASTVHAMREEDPEALYRAMIDGLKPIAGDLAFLDISETPGHRDLTRTLRSLWPGALILNPHRDEAPLEPHEVVRDVLDSGVADVVALGRSFLANPDLPHRIAAGGPYNTPQPETFYGGDAGGYTDYPALAG
ncbi:alkene reductase [Streptomyces sp. TS71-3]|uniref:oxidoreductase n=1 Tax=Streptomyces sp. TS71-3 TaxID=2733862 RepID=UPI001B222722|nr:alkene reductase [Streptomyces sp. TS71-3]GHJ41130.1 alkene reductase [Streptomyces sp. TS71-3]